MKNEKEMNQSGFQVDEKRKKIWAVELAMLERFLLLCDKYNLKYYAIGGTLLGAVRHQGFIPWDDDIDIGMMRGDYNKFIQIAEKELEFPFVLQTTENEPWCYRPHAQIRNSSTTGFLRTERNLICNKGIFIDIFPLDGVPDKERLYKNQMRRLKIKNRIFMNYFFFDVVHEEPPIIKAAAHQIVKAYFKLFDHKRSYRRFEELASKYSFTETEKIGELTILFDNKHYHWKKNWFGNGKLLPFEHLQLTVPNEYDLVLKNTFGNYMEFPKDKENSSLHSGMVFEPDVSYTEYFSKHSD